MAHIDSAYNLASWLVRDAALAEDVVQDAMERALKYFSGFRGENARAWVLQIVRNVALTHLKGSQRVALRTLAQVELDSPEAVLADPLQEPEAIAVREDGARFAQALLERMPIELRECLVLRELEELSYKEIARVIDAPIGTVMSRLWRARQWLTQATTVTQA